MNVIYQLLSVFDIISTLSHGNLFVSSGIFCFLVDIHWFHLNADAKVPMYAFLGIALWFAFVFMILDVVNYLYQCAMSRMSNRRKRVLSGQAFVSTPTQIWLVLVMTTGLGVYFGKYRIDRLAAGATGSPFFHQVL